MENYENPNPRPVSRFRRMLGNSTIRIVLAGIIVLSASFITYAVVSPMQQLENLEAEFKAASENAFAMAAAYNKANEERCVVERELAAKKLEVHYGGNLELEIDDIIRISNKALWDCSPGSGAVNFMQNP